MVGRILFKGVSLKILVLGFHGALTESSSRYPGKLTQRLDAVNLFQIKKIKNKVKDIGSWFLVLEEYGVLVLSLLLMLRGSKAGMI